MKTLLIQSSDKSGTDLLVRFARKMKMKARYLSDEKLEDRWLASMIRDAEEEGGEVPREKVMRQLKKNGAAL